MYDVFVVLYVYYVLLNRLALIVPGPGAASSRVLVSMVNLALILMATNISLALFLALILQVGWKKLFSETFIYTTVRNQ